MAQALQERVRKCTRRPKKWAAKNANDANVDRVRTLVRSDRRVGVRVIEELNMNRETVRQIVKEKLGKRKLSTKMVPRILTRNNVGFTFYLIFYATQICLIGHYG
jgi:hypothetical protein